MITIQSAMLVTLGFLAATLLALVLAPAFWARAVRLTARRVKEAMPFTEAEIRADKDRIRAENAIRVHSLENQVERVRLASARQMIDLNRRDAGINEREGEIERLRTALEEAQNARRVLEQTVSDRLPRVEQRLSDARKLIFNRDREISDLGKAADKQSGALAEAAAINAQQTSEIERLATSLVTRGARSQDGPSDARHDAEVALRSELEALRAKTRDQSQLIGRMQSQMARFGDVAAMTGNGARAPAGVGVAETPGAGWADATGAATAGDGAAAGQRELEGELRRFRASTEDQAGEIARLKASLAVFEAGGGDEPRLSIRESKIGLKARLGSLVAHNEQQKETIAKLRSEIAAANERLARQAAHYTSELKRLGAGTLPASGQPRRQATQPRATLAERVAQQRTASSSGSHDGPPDGKSNGTGASDTGPNGATVSDHREKAKATAGAEAGTGAAGPASSGSEDAGLTATRGGEPEAAPAQRRPRLLERLSSIAKTS